MWWGFWRDGEVRWEWDGIAGVTSGSEGEELNSFVIAAVLTEGNVWT